MAEIAAVQDEIDQYPPETRLHTKEKAGTGSPDPVQGLISLCLPNQLIGFPVEAQEVSRDAAEAAQPCALCRRRCGGLPGSIHYSPVAQLHLRPFVRSRFPAHPFARF